jgi:hypothetical protein
MYVHQERDDRRQVRGFEEKSRIVAALLVSSASLGYNKSKGERSRRRDAKACADPV